MLCPLASASHFPHLPPKKPKQTLESWLTTNNKILLTSSIIFTAMYQMQASTEILPLFLQLGSFLRHASVLNLKLNAGQAYINTTNPLIPHTAQTLRQ